MKKDFITTFLKSIKKLMITFLGNTTATQETLPFGQLQQVLSAIF